MEACGWTCSPVLSPAPSPDPRHRRGTGEQRPTPRQLSGAEKEGLAGSPRHLLVPVVPLAQWAVWWSEGPSCTLRPVFLCLGPLAWQVGVVR